MAPVPAGEGAKVAGETVQACPPDDEDGVYRNRTGGEVENICGWL